MLPLQNILAGFRKAAVEPTWRAAFSAAVSTRGRGAQESGLCKVGASFLPGRHFAALQRSKADLSALLPSNAEYFEVF
ncbi:MULTISPECIES: hypothetical protein, partial [unclassified Phaeobacter]|uniref:hypothetical protein n=1 Tax=unclassified Phaeobacter TaxID=2621772 RepID=UPI003A88D455